MREGSISLHVGPGDTKEALRAIVALHEAQLELREYRPLPDYSIFSLHQAIRDYAACLSRVQDDHCHCLEKTEGTLQLHLEVSVERMRVRWAALSLREEGSLIFAVGLLAVSHHGIEELFGLLADHQDRQHPIAFHLSMRHQVNWHYRCLWRAYRWASANFLVWDTYRIVHPRDLDGPNVDEARCPGCNRVL